MVSAGNSGLYASTRMLFNLAGEGKAPAFFTHLTRNGVPLFALLATAMVSALCFLSSMFDNASVYMWLLNMTGMTGFIAWLGIAVSHYRFRRGYVQQGHDINELPYRSAFFPAGTIFAFLLCLAVTFGQNYQAFLQDNIDWYGVASTYIGIPIFLVLWMSYKIITRSCWISYDEMRFDKQK